MRSGYPDG
jgi:hypothetical protein